MEYRILAIGDVTSEDGLKHLRRHLAPLKKLKNIAFTVVNGENISGTGLTPAQADELFAAGADVITLGNHTFGKMQIRDMLEETPDDLEAELWTDSLEYLACCVEAEAGNQSELGKRLVCDTVLNRFDSGKYETLYDVINEEHNGVYQYSVVEDGRIFEVTPTEETYRIVAEEIDSHTNTEVLYFQTGHYHTFGTPLFKEDDHYFSK